MPSYDALLQERLKMIRQDIQEREQFLKEQGEESAAEIIYKKLMKEQYELEKLAKKDK